MGRRHGQGQVPGAIGLNIVAVPPASLIEIAAREIVARERARLPNLTSVTVLVPNLHAAGAIGQALCRAADVPTLLLPRITTLQQLAADFADGPPPIPASLRQATLYQALRGRNWFHEADLWHISAELLRLFDELTLSLATLPVSGEDFLAQLEKAYETRAGASLQFEARLVHELWYAMARDPGGNADAATRHCLRLTHLAREARGPLYGIGLADLSPAEKAFFDRRAEHQPTLLFEFDAESAAADLRAALLAAAWNDDAPGLLDRAGAFRAHQPESPLQGRLALFGAGSLEQEAQAVAAKICRWLAQGRTAIAVVVQDRLVARRARALLERYQVLVEDETGWTFSTTSASTVVMRWLDALGSRFHHLDLLDLLKSPFVFADWGATRRKHAVFSIEQAVRRHGVVSHLPRYREVAGEDPDAAAALLRLDEAQRVFGRRARPLAEWLQSLLESLEILGIRQGLSGDAAGNQLLQLIERLHQEIAADTAPYRRENWRQWLNQQLEAATFRDETLESPVVFTHLAACRLRRFDAAIIAGADAAHLPGPGRESVFFNQSVRSQLGLPTLDQTVRTQQLDLIGLLATCGETWVTWQARKNAEPNLLSPWFERLHTFHELCYGIGLLAPEPPPELPAGPAETGALPEPTLRPAPSLPESAVPAEVSASGYNSLVACPYRFFARHALHLNELDEVQPALEKRDYGEYVHLVLQRFHERRPVLGGNDPELLRQELQAVTDEVFARAIEADYLSHAWALRWSARIPGYIDWQLAREAQGWRWQDGELRRTLEIVLGGGIALTLKGRLDRVDAGPDGARAVLDYKAQTRDSLRRKLEIPGEDVQLPVYALLLGQLPAEAAFVALDDDEVRQVAPAEELADLSEATLDRLKSLFERMRKGAPLPAQGAETVCEYCEMRGLCRKDYWS